MININITELEEKVITTIGDTIDGIDVDAPDTTEEDLQDPLIHFTPNGISFWWNNIHNKESA